MLGHAGTSRLCRVVAQGLARSQSDWGTERTAMLVYVLGYIALAHSLNDVG